MRRRSRWWSNAAGTPVGALRRGWAGEGGQAGASAVRPVPRSVGAIRWVALPKGHDDLGVLLVGAGRPGDRGRLVLAEPQCRSTSRPAAPAGRYRLNNPRGITFGPDGALSSPNRPGVAGPCQAGPKPVRSASAAPVITRIERPVVPGRHALPSLASRAGTEAAGPSDVGVDRPARSSSSAWAACRAGARSPRMRGMAKLYKNRGTARGGRRHRRVRAAGQPGRHLAAGHQPAGPGRGRQLAVRRRRGRQLAGQGRRPGPHLDRRDVQGASVRDAGRAR